MKSAHTHHGRGLFARSWMLGAAVAVLAAAVIVLSIRPGVSRAQTFSFTNTFGLDADGSQLLFPFGNPLDGEVCPDGNVYMVDSQNGHVQIFDQTGIHVGSFGEPGSFFDMTPGTFISPLGLSCDDNYVYVTDFHGIQVFNLGGSHSYVTVIEAPALMTQIIGVDVGSDGRVYAIIGTFPSSSIQVFSPAPTFAPVLTIAKDPSCPYYPDPEFPNYSTLCAPFAGNFGGIAVSGNEVCASSSNSFVACFSTVDGSFLHYLAVNPLDPLPPFYYGGMNDGEFSNPIGLDADEAGNWYVADTNNNRVQRFQADGTFMDVLTLIDQYDQPVRLDWLYGLDLPGDDLFGSDPMNARGMHFTEGADPGLGGTETNNTGIPIKIQIGQAVVGLAPGSSLTWSVNSETGEETWSCDVGDCKVVTDATVDGDGTITTTATSHVIILVEGASISNVGNETLDTFSTSGPPVLVLTDATLGNTGEVVVLASTFATSAQNTVFTLSPNGTIHHVGFETPNGLENLTAFSYPDVFSPAGGAVPGPTSVVSEIPVGGTVVMTPAGDSTTVANATPGPVGGEPEPEQPMIYSSASVDEVTGEITPSETSTAVQVPSNTEVQVTPGTGSETTVENTTTNPAAEEPTVYSDPTTDASGDIVPSETSTAVSMPAATTVEMSSGAGSETNVANTTTAPAAEDPTVYSYPATDAAGDVVPSEITSTAVAIPQATSVQVTPGIGSGETTVANTTIDAAAEDQTAYSYPAMDASGDIVPGETSVAVLVPSKAVVQETSTQGSNRTELENLSVLDLTLRSFSAPSVDGSGNIVPGATSILASVPKNAILRWSLNSPATFDMVSYADAAKPALSAAKVTLGANNAITGSLGSVWVVSQSDPASKYVIDTTATTTTVSNQSSVATNTLSLYLCATCFVGGDGTFNNPGNVSPLTVAPGETVVAGDTDGDLVLDGDDACPTTAGRADFQGCPVAIANTVTLHTIDKTKPRTFCAGKGSCKMPVEGAQIKVFDRDLLVGHTITCDGESVTLERGDLKPKLYSCIFEDTSLASAQKGSCTTNSLGQCTAGVETIDEYLDLTKFVDPVTGKTGYTGRKTQLNDFVNGLATEREKLLFICTRNENGSSSCQGGGKTTVTGSLLEIIYPLYTVWDETIEYYPFIFTSDSDWTVDLCLAVPEGYKITDSSACVQTLVAGEVATVFTVVETGSPEPNVKVKMKVSHVKNVKKGKQIKSEKVEKDIEILIPGERTLKMKQKGKGKGRASLYLGMSMAALACMSVILITTRRRRSK